MPDSLFGVWCGWVIRLKLLLVTISNGCLGVLGALLGECVRVLQGMCMGDIVCWWEQKWVGKELKC